MKLDALLKKIKATEGLFLDLTGCHICDTEIGPIVDAINRNRGIERVSLKFNSVSNKGAEKLSELLFVKDLDLSHNDIDDACLKSLAENKNIKNLNLIQNNITDSGLEILIQYSTQQNISAQSLFTTKGKEEELYRKTDKARNNKVESDKKCSL